MERILNYFRSYTPVSDEAWVYFTKYMKLRQYHSGDIIQPLYQPCDKLCFIFEGVARSYIQKPDGKDFTWFFHYDYKDSFVKEFILTDYPSLNLQIPSIYGFQALSKCEIAFIGYRDLASVFANFPELLVLDKILTNGAYHQTNLRLQSLLAKPAQGRLEDFVRDHSVLFSMIPHYYIASYLGITPQRLCQLRNKLSKWEA